MNKYSRFKMCIASWKIFAPAGRGSSVAKCGNGIDDVGNFAPKLCNGHRAGALHQRIEKTAWPGRLEKAGDQPHIRLDGAHNTEGIKALVQTIKNMDPVIAESVL